MDVKWYGTNALEFQCANGTDFMIDIYVSRDRKRLNIPEEVERYVTTKPSWVLMTHAHWDHLADMPQIIARTGTVLYASRTACNIMRSLGVSEANLHEIHYGDRLELPGKVQVTVLESRHKGNPNEPVGYEALPAKELLASADNWRCGEVFAFLIEADGRRILNSGSANFLDNSAKPVVCDEFFCGISRWEEGFPQMLERNVRFQTLIPTHHDEFRKPLSEFALRGDLPRLKEALPTLVAKEIPPLEWRKLPLH